MTAMLGKVTAKDIEQAIYNCYPSGYDKLFAILYKQKHGHFPFNPQLN